MKGPAPGMVAGWTPPGARGRRGRRRARRAGGMGGPGRVLVWRVVAGIGAVVLAVVAGVVAGRPEGGGQAAAASGVAVLVLARDLPAGAVPGGADLRTVLLPAPAVPADAVPPAAGGGGAVGPLAVAVRRGDVLTGRQLGAGWAPAGALRAYSLPVGDGVEAGPLAPGDRVDVLTAADGRARTVLRAAPVLRLLPGGDGRAALVVLGVAAGQAEALAAARAAGTLTLVQAPPG
jgi:pilus assembly protein CpaB